MFEAEKFAKMKQRLADILSSQANPDARFIHDYDELLMILAWLREAGKIIVQTSGVFDSLHEGHPKYLERAKSFGDILVVGVDTDARVKEVKGPKRPLRPFADRCRLMAYFRSVDILTEQHGYLHRIVRPDVLVASETSEAFPARREDMLNHCGRLEVLPAQSDIHSTDLIKKLNED